MSRPPERLLLIRNDKLGDFMLAWPAFALLKAALPHSCLAALVPAYTRVVAEQCPWVDEIIEDPGGDWRTLASRLRGREMEAAIALFSTARVARALRAAGVPYRLAPATKWFQIFYNHRLRQRRSRSVKPEFEYNLDLVRHYLRGMGIIPSEEALIRPFWRFPPREIEAERRALMARHGLDPRRPWVLIHPGHGGSASNLTPEAYAELAAGLNPRAQIVVGAGPGELETAHQVAAALKARGRAAVIQADHDDVVAYARIIACMTVFIGGSTGPLHVAGALDVPTAGFYPRGRVTSSLRWQTLNSPARRLAFAPPAEAGENEMAAIDLGACAEAINARFLVP